MRKFLLLSSLMLTAAAFAQAQTPSYPQIVPPAPPRLVEDEDFYVTTEMVWEPEYHLEAWVAVIKTHYAGVQAMASKPDPAPLTLDPNWHAPLVIRSTSTQ